MSRSRGALAVSAGIFLSRIAGLAREAVVRGRLGLGGVNDAYSAALRIPNLMQKRRPSCSSPAASTWLR